MSWRPLLDGEDAARAQEAIEAIAADLEARPLARPDLDMGHAGQALLHATLARAGHPERVERAVHALEAALGGLDQVPGPWLVDGAAGVAWVAAHLGDLVEVDEDSLAELDALVAQVLAAEPWPFRWDHVAGLVGLGVYALERSGAAGLCDRVVGQLALLAERSTAGATWRDPEGHHDLGVAHGVAGVIAFLAGAAADTAGAAPLLADAVRWLLAHDTGDPKGRFPYRLLPEPENPRPRRDGWCYGDQGVAVALVRAGRVVGEPAWIERGLELARDVARRRPAALDVSLCHGTAGRAHMFNRLAQATGSDELAEAARVWYRETLARRQPGQGIGGYRSELGAGDDGSLVIGATGVALGLAAGCSSAEPVWDRAFLLSARPA
jgi:lantibiotic modifying enzyme